MSPTAPARPHALVPDLAGIPRELADRHRWVAWRFERRDDKWTKIPLVTATGALASSTDPSTWAPFEDAVAAYERGGFDGIGFVVTTADRCTGVDLDRCLDPESGVIEPWARAIVERLDSYTEVTPSARGLRVWVQGTLPPGGRRKGPVELYDTGRYFTLTGRRLPGTPPAIESRQAELAALHEEIFADRPGATDGQRSAEPVDLDDAALLERAHAARNGPRFSQLWAGDWQGAGYPSQSEADQALVSLLCFWTGRDGARVDRLFRQSGLFRPKWDARHFGDGRTYGAATLARGIERCGEVYTGRGDIGPPANGTGSGAAPEVDGPVLVCLDDVRAEDVEWTWRDRIARGKLTLAVGEPGSGKTYVTLDGVARTTIGAAWPDGGRAPAGAALLLTSEDGLADTVRPIIDRQGGNAARVHVLQAVRVEGQECPFTLERDLPALEAAIMKTHAVLVVISPLSAYLGKKDSYKDAEIRGLLTPLAALAERLHVAVIGIMHLTKAQTRRLLLRAQGSIAFVAQARTVLVVGELPDSPGRRVLASIKNNLGPEPPPLAFRIGDAGLTWEDAPLTGTADALLAGDAMLSRSDQRERDQASSFLRDMLADGPMASKVLEMDARSNGIATRTLWRAKQDLGVIAERARGQTGAWYWMLPRQPETEP